MGPLDDTHTVYKTARIGIKVEPFDTLDNNKEPKINSTYDTLEVLLTDTLTHSTDNENNAYEQANNFLCATNDNYVYEQAKYFLCTTNDNNAYEQANNSLCTTNDNNAYEQANNSLCTTNDINAYEQANNSLCTTNDSNAYEQANNSLCTTNDSNAYEQANNSLCTTKDSSAYEQAKNSLCTNNDNKSRTEPIQTYNYLKNSDEQHDTLQNAPDYDYVIINDLINAYYGIDDGAHSSIYGPCNTSANESDNTAAKNSKDYNCNR